jgi:hypothetical protein
VQHLTLYFAHHRPWHGLRKISLTVENPISDSTANPVVMQ